MEWETEYIHSYTAGRTKLNLGHVECHGTEAHPVLHLGVGKTELE